jgi:hypothetical protein
MPRVLKIGAYYEFIYRLDAVMSKPFILRIFKTISTMLYLIHLNACAFYAISAWEGIGTNSFVYDGEVCICSCSRSIIAIEKAPLGCKQTFWQLPHSRRVFKNRRKYYLKSNQIICQNMI